MSRAKSQLAALRLNKGLTQSQLAEQLVVERTTVARWERGETLPTVSVRNLLADVLGVSLSELLKVLSDGFSFEQSEKEFDQIDHVRARVTSSSRPTLVLISGFAGSGKTFLANELSRLTGWTMFDKDMMSRPLCEALLFALGKNPNDRESDAYLNEVRPFEYRSFMSAIISNISLGNSVIASAPFLQEVTDAAWLEQLDASLETANAKRVIVWISCSANIMHLHLQERDAARDAWKLAHWTEYTKLIDFDRRPIPPYQTIVNDTKDNATLYLAAEKLSEELLGSS